MLQLAPVLMKIPPEKPMQCYKCYIQLETGDDLEVAREMEGSEQGLGLKLHWLHRGGLVNAGRCKVCCWYLRC